MGTWLGGRASLRAPPATISQFILLVYFWAGHGHHSHRAKIYQRKTPLYGTGKIFLSQPTLTQDIYQLYILQPLLDGLALDICCHQGGSEHSLQSAPSQPSRALYEISPTMTNSVADFYTTDNLAALDANHLCVDLTKKTSQISLPPRTYLSKQAPSCVGALGSQSKFNPPGSLTSIVICGALLHLQPDRSASSAKPLVCQVRLFGF